MTLVTGTILRLIGIVALAAVVTGEAVGQDTLKRAHGFPQALSRGELRPILTAFKVLPYCRIPSGYKRRLVELSFYPTHSAKGEWMLHLGFASADDTKTFDIFEALKSRRFDAGGHLFLVHYDSVDASLEGHGREIRDQIFTTSGKFDILMLSDSLSRAEMNKALAGIVGTAPDASAAKRH
jgi:hypothetical protein